MDREPDGLRRRLLMTLPLMAMAPGLVRGAGQGPLLRPESRGTGARQGTLLLKNADLIACMDQSLREIKQGHILITGNRITAVSSDDKLRDWPADEVIDMRGHIVIPGLINTHHHMYQTLTRAVPGAQGGELFNWLTTLYPMWQKLTPEMIRISTKTAMAELMLSGCTTTSDHLYVYPNGCRLDDSIYAAREMGMRFHACRGSMSLGQSRGGLPPDNLVEKEGRILSDTQRVIEEYHDYADGAMLRIAVAPCSPFTVSQDLMRQSAALARSYRVSMHTHLAENESDVRFSREKYRMTPAQYAENLGWVGKDVWHAHCVKLDDSGIKLFARTGTGVAHCPCSNMRLASGIARIKQMRAAGISVGLGVDGSASNDSSSLIAEVRQALLLQRVGFGPDAMTAREALALATTGGASVLNRQDIGTIAPGMMADIVAFDLNAIGLAGGGHDPLASLVFCNPGRVAYSIINGQVRVRRGQLEMTDLPELIHRHNALAMQLARS